MNNQFLLLAAPFTDTTIPAAAAWTIFTGWMHLRQCGYKSDLRTYYTILNVLPMYAGQSSESARIVQSMLVEGLTLNMHVGIYLS